jgi:uncharacterized repeat protein (TIGR01451 family)
MLKGRCQPGAPQVTRIQGLRLLSAIGELDGRDKFEAASPECVHSIPKKSVTCDLGTLTLQETRELTITVEVKNSAGNTIDNTASVTTTATDTDPSNNTDTEQTGVNTQPDLVIVKTDQPDPVVPGEQLAYTIVYTNSGGADADSVVVTDTLPAEIQFDDATGTYTYTPPDTVEWSLGTVSSGGGGTFVLSATVRSWANQTFTNTVQISTSSAESDLTNNQHDEGTDVTTLADMAITKVDSQDPVGPGTTLFYTLTVSNVGASDAESAVVTDTLPAEVLFNAATPGYDYTSPDMLVWDLDTFTAGDSQVFTIEVTVESWVTSTFTNTAVVTTTTPDEDPSNNRHDEPTDVSLSADATITKVDDTDPVMPGDWFTYTLTVQNVGLAAAENVVVTDTLPAEVQFSSATPPFEFTWPDTVEWDLNTVSSGQTEVLTIAVRARNWINEAFTNTVVVTTTTPDKDPTNNEAQERTGVPVDLSVVKTDDPDPVMPGSPLTYTLTVYNDGPSGAYDVVLTDTLPTEVQFDSATPPFTFIWPRTVVWDLDAIGAGDSQLRSVAVTVRSSAHGVMTNTAAVSTTSVDRDPSDNEVEEPTTVNIPPVAIDDTATTAISTPLTITVTANDYDPDGDFFWVDSVGAPLTGTASVSPTTSVVYTPTGSFGTDVFTYTVSDGTMSDMATVTVTVLPFGVSISGPLNGTVDVSHTFTATVYPTATLTLTYTWEATGQTPEQHVDLGTLTDTMPFTWTMAGTQCVTVTVSNVDGTVSDTHVISIGAQLGPLFGEFGNVAVYLPIIMKVRP